MKKYLRLLALIVASAIPGLAMAATDYGITIAGVSVTSDNASNIKGSWLKRGSISYDASKNHLILNNVDIRDGSIIVKNTVPNNLYIIVNGVCDIASNGVTIQIYDTFTNGVTIRSKDDTEATLNLHHYESGNITKYGGTIYCYKVGSISPRLTIGRHNMYATAHSALTLNAKQIRGGGKTTDATSYTNRLYICDAIVNLTGIGGTQYATIKDFNEVIFPQNSTGAAWPSGKFQTSGISYSTTNARIEKSGSLYTGSLQAGWQTYNLKVCGITVTERNKDDIGDYTNPSNYMSITKHGYSSTHNATGSLTYDPTNNILTIGANGGVDINCNSGGFFTFEAAIENNTGKLLKIRTKSASDITTGSYHGILSDQSLTFDGGSTTELKITTTNGNSIRLTADNLTVKFDNAKVTMTSWPADCINTDSPTDHRWTWTLYDSNVTTTGCIRGVKAYNFSGCGIATEKVIIDPYGGNAASPMGHLRLFGEGEYFGEFKVARASTSYGFSIVGIPVNNVNANNLYNEFVTGGTAVYDANAKTLTLNNFQVDYQNKKQATHINISKSAPEDLTIVANGNNYFKNAKSGGYAMVITNADGVSTSQVSRYIKGTGTLDLGTGSINLAASVWFNIGNGVQGGEGNGGVTLKAGSIYGETAVLSFTDGQLELSGNSNGTLRGIRSLQNNVTGFETTPSNVSMSDNNLVQNGSLYKGALSIGWKKYGLTVCNVPVTYGNKSNIKVPDTDPLNPVLTVNNSASTAAANGAISYDPDNNRLTLKNVCIWDNHNANRGEAVIDNQTGKDFYILTSSNSTIVRSDGQPCGVRSNSMLTFQGGELLVTGTTANNCKALIVMDGDDLPLRFWNSSNTTLEGYGTSAPAVCCAQEGQWMRLETHDCNLTTKGSLKNISKYTPDRTGITNNKVIWDSQCRSFIPWGNTSALVTTVNFARATSYGITIAGLDLNTVTKDNFYCEALKAGSVSYDENNKTVTLNNVQADMSSLSSSTSGININSSAPDKLKLNIVGNNTFTGYNNAVAMVINKETNASLSSVTRYITGTGVLDLGADGSIRLNNQPWICIGNGVQGGEGLGGVTVKASSIYGQSGSSTARLSITDGALELSGKSSGTLYNINTLFGPTDDGMEMTPSDVSFNSSNYRVEQNGSLYTGALRIGWEDYGLSICGIKVNGGNKNDIKGEYITGTVSYDPSNKTLTLNGAGLEGTFTEGGAINNTIDGLTIKTVATGKQQKDNYTGYLYDSYIGTSRSHGDIRTTGNINFAGTGILHLYASVGSCVIMDGHELTANFKSGSKTVLYAWDADPNETSIFGVTEADELCGIVANNATITTNGWIKNIGLCDLNNCDFKPLYGGSTGNQFVGTLFIDEFRDHQMHCYNGYGTGLSSFHGKAEIVPCQEYGMRVGGYMVNTLNQKLVAGSGLYGNVSYDPDEKVLSLYNVSASCQRNRFIDGKWKTVYYNGINLNGGSEVEDLKIQVEGNNLFYHIDGVGMAIYKNTTVTGNGTLTLSKNETDYVKDDSPRAAIGLFNNADLTLGETVTINAERLYGSSGSLGGNLWLCDNYTGTPTLDLSGDGKNPTVSKIALVCSNFDSGMNEYGNDYTTILIPNGGWYDSRDGELVLKKRALDNEPIEKGHVLFGPATDYGIMINAMRVNSYNAEDILAGTNFKYTGKLSYDDSNRLLTMDNLTLESGRNFISFQVYGAPNVYNWLTINLIGKNEWTNPNIMEFKAGNVQFTGTGSLTYPADIVLSRTQRELIGADHTTLESSGDMWFTDCTINATGIRSSVDGMNLVNGELDVYGATINLSGSGYGTISGFATEPYIGSDTHIVTPAGWSWYDYADQYGNHNAYLTTDGSTRYTGEVRMYPSYGIFVANTEITGNNKDDVLGDGGSVSFTLGTDDQTDPMAWMPHLILKRATINGNIVMQESTLDGYIILQLIDENKINAGRTTGIQSQKDFVVWSENAYGKLYINGTGTGVELMNNAEMQIGNAELNINVGNYGIKGQYTGEIEDPTGTNRNDGYESVSIYGSTGEGEDVTGAPIAATTLYSKLVVKNNNSRYPLVGNLFRFDMEDGVAVQEPARAVFSGEQFGFIGSNGNLLSNTTLIISNDDYNTVGIEEVEKADISNAGDVYDLSGRKMNNTRIQRGVYVVGGKKVAVK